MNIKGIANFILGYESLLNTGILHRDVSIGNIMLTENEDDGFLTDYDLATRTSNDRASGAPSKTGTKVFMAIGALKGEYHNTMHDLESFFWVLFWICIHWNGPYVLCYSQESCRMLIENSTILLLLTDLDLRTH